MGHAKKKGGAVQLRVSNVVRTGVSTLPWFPAHDLDGQGPTGEVRCANGLRLFTLRDVRSAGDFRFQARAVVSRFEVRRARWFG